MDTETARRRAKQVAGMIGAAVVIGAIIWIDVATGLWQELVIVAGLAAGLVTFLLTVLVLDRVIARSTARRWAPLNRLALSEFLHAIADEQRSEISRGAVVPRALAPPASTLDGEPLHTALRGLRDDLVRERRLLSEVLSRWSGFLASSGDNEAVLLHVAEFALRLDTARDAALDVEAAPHDPLIRERLHDELAACNTALHALAAELRDRLSVADRGAATRSAASRGAAAA